MASPSTAVRNVGDEGTVDTVSPFLSAMQRCSFSMDERCSVSMAELMMFFEDGTIKVPKFLVECLISLYQAGVIGDPCSWRHFTESQLATALLEGDETLEMPLSAPVISWKQWKMRIAAAGGSERNRALIVEARNDSCGTREILKIPVHLERLQLWPTSCLRTLRAEECPKLSDFSFDCILNLTSLESLHLISCPELRDVQLLRFPWESSLTTTAIIGCPKLSELLVITRCPKLSKSQDGQLESRVTGIKSGQRLAKATDAGSPSCNSELRYSLALVHQESTYWNYGCNKSIGAVWRRTPTEESMEFFFHDHMQMASCIGVGYKPKKCKVILSSDLRISIHEMPSKKYKKERALCNSTDFGDGRNVEQLVIDYSALIKSTEEDIVSVEHYGSGADMSKVHGIGLGGGPTLVYKHDKGDENERQRLPLLHYIALAIVQYCPSIGTTSRNTGSNSCAGRTGTCVEGSSSQVGESQMKQNLFKVHNISRKWGSDGDGDEEGQRGSIASAHIMDEDEFAFLKVSFHPLPNEVDLRDKRTKEKLKGLVGASIWPKFLFLFRRSPNYNQREISIKATTMLHLETTKEVREAENRFGWCHPRVGMSLHCECATEAMLHSRELSCDPATANTLTIESTQSRSSTQGGDLSLGAEVSVAGVLNVNMGGSSSLQAATSSNQTVGTSATLICNGFSITDNASPTGLTYELTCPSALRGDGYFSKWYHEKYHSGLCSTIEPSIEGTWHPCNSNPASEYKFEVSRTMKLLPLKEEKIVGNDLIAWNQDFPFLFFINHAMNHLPRRGFREIQLRQGRHGELTFTVDDTMSILNLCVLP